MIDESAALLAGTASSQSRLLVELERAGVPGVEVEALRRGFAPSLLAAKALVAGGGADWKPPGASPAAAAHHLGLGGGSLSASSHHLEHGQTARAAELAGHAARELAAAQVDERAPAPVRAGATELLGLLRRSNQAAPGGDRKRISAEIDAALRALQERLLLDEIAQHPDAIDYLLERDQQLRQAFATLIETRDHARAELIRIQIEIFRARAAGQPVPPRLPARERDLLGKHGRGWAAVTDQVAGYRFARGFVIEITLSARQLLERHPRLYALAPITRLVIRGGTRDELDALFGSPALARIRGLDLAGQAIGDAGAGRLAASPHVERLAYLNLSDNRISLSGLRSLAESPYLGALAIADFAGNPDDPGAVSPAPGEWELPPVGRQLEEEHGARIPWLHRYRWASEVDLELISRS